MHVHNFTSGSDRPIAENADSSMVLIVRCICFMLGSPSGPSSPGTSQLMVNPEKH